MKPVHKPRQILLSKRANVFYMEHVRVMQKDGRIIYLGNTGNEVENYFNLPGRNTAFLLLGKGTSITDAAARRLAESNVVVGFVGNGGSPGYLFADMVFFSSTSEYRPTEYMQAWVELWLNDTTRTAAARDFLQTRFEFVIDQWRRRHVLPDAGLSAVSNMANAMSVKLNTASDAAHLMAIEAEWAKGLYRLLAQHYRIGDFARRDGEGKRATPSDIANSFLDHGNYLAYGYASVALVALGISFAFPLLHGKTRRGALVFDVADLFKDAIVMPAAFEAATTKITDQQFRDGLVDSCLAAEVIDFSIDTIKKVVGKN